jgi:hypothetical protein
MTGAAAGRHFGATVGVRRAGHGRPGRDLCNADVDEIAHTHTHDSLTHTRTRIDVVDVEVCMQLDTHTDARTKAHARTRAQPRMYGADGCAHSAGLTRALTHAHT